MHNSIDMEQVIDLTVASVKADGYEATREEIRGLWDWFDEDTREKFGWSPLDYQKPEDVGYDVYFATICEAYSLADGLNKVGHEARKLFDDSLDWLDSEHSTPLHAVLGSMAPSLCITMRDILMESLRQKLDDWHEPEGLGLELDGLIEGSEPLLSRLITASLASGLDVTVLPPLVRPV